MNMTKEIVVNVATNEGDVIRDGHLIKSGTPNARFATLYFFHEDIEESQENPDGTYGPPRLTRAFAVPVEKPITRARAINAAEMAAYGLNDAMEVASFNASLARKWRENPQDAECIEHDQFIEAIKDGLNDMGIK